MTAEGPRLPLPRVPSPRAGIPRRRRAWDVAAAPSPRRAVWRVQPRYRRPAVSVLPLLRLPVPAVMPTEAVANLRWISPRHVSRTAGCRRPRRRAPAHRCRRSTRRLMGPEMREDVLQEAFRQIAELVLLYGGPVAPAAAVDAGAQNTDADMPFCGHRRRVGLRLVTTTALSACICCCWMVREEEEER